MLLGRYKQQPGENLKRILDYDLWLEEDEEILTATAEITPVTVPPLVVNPILIDAEGRKFAYNTSGGLDGEDYEIKFIVTSNIAQVRNDEIEIEVEEI